MGVETDSVSALQLSLVCLLQNPPYLSSEILRTSQSCPGALNMLETWIAQTRIMIPLQIRRAVATAVGVCIYMHAHVCARLCMLPVSAQACVCMCLHCVNAEKLMTVSLLLSYCTWSLKGMFFFPFFNQSVFDLQCVSGVQQSDSDIYIYIGLSMYLSIYLPKYISDSFPLCGN